MTTPTYVFGRSGMSGGGGVNAIGVDPLNDLRQIAGGDNNGTKVTIDGGVSWDQAMSGMGPDNNMGQIKQCCGIVPISGSNWCIALTKDGGYFTKNWAQSWTKIAGDSSGFNAGSARPRVDGHIGVDDTAGHVFAVDAGGDIWRYNYNLAGGAVAAPVKIGSAAGVGTGCDLNVPDNTTLVVTTRTNVYKVTNLLGAAGSATVTKYTNSTGRAEEVALVKESSTWVGYVAAYNTVRRISDITATGATFSDISPPTGSQWCAVAAIRISSATHVLAGCGAEHTANGDGFDPISGDAHEAIFESINGGSSWVSVLTNAAGYTLVNHMGSDTGAAWWGYLGQTAGGLSNNRLGNSWAPEQIEYNNDGSKIIASGQQGVFVCVRSTKKWYPMMVGMATTTSDACKVDPRNDNIVVLTNTDHTFFISQDKGVTFRKHEKGTTQGETMGTTACIDPGHATRWFLAIADRDTSGSGPGEVYYADNPLTFNVDWQDTGLHTAVGAGGHVLGVAARRVGANLVVLAAVAHATPAKAGIYKRTFTNPTAMTGGSWSRQSGAVLANWSNLFTEYSLEWPDSGHAYFMDKNSGVWASTDQGATWTNRLAWVDSNERQGWLSCASDAPNAPLLSLGQNAAGGHSGLWRLDNGASGPITPVAIKKPGGVAFAYAGPVIAKTGGLAAVVENCSAAGTAGDPAIYRCEDVRVASPLMTNIADSAARAGGATRTPVGIGMDSTGRIYISSRGGGMIIGQPSTGAPVPPTIDGFSPGTGSVGDSVVISGSGFTGTTGAAGVKFNGINATSYTVDADSQITAVVPTGGSGPITVTTPNGFAMSATSFILATGPVVSSFTPTHGALTDAIVITGLRFTSATSVKIGGVNAASFHVDSATQITFHVAAGNDGKITVTTPSGSDVSDDPFSLDAAAAIFGFSPDVGDAGITIEIDGEGFTGATAVKVDGVNMDSFTVVDDGTITAVIPAGPPEGLITVTTPSGTATSGTSFFAPPPDDDDGADYRMVYYGARGYTDHTFEVMAIVTDSGVDKTSKSNPVVTYRPRPVGIWFVDRTFADADDPATLVQMISDFPTPEDSLPAAIGESSTQFYGVGRRSPVTITDNIRGYEDTVKGYVQSQDDLKALERMKSDSVNGQHVRLIAGDLNIPVELGKLTIGRVPTEAGLYPVSVFVTQVGEFSIPEQVSGD